jgi:hypothetical protein
MNASRSASLGQQSFECFELSLQILYAPSGYVGGKVIITSPSLTRKTSCLTGACVIRFLLWLRYLSNNLITGYTEKPVKVGTTEACLTAETNGTSSQVRPVVGSQPLLNCWRNVGSE